MTSSRSIGRSAVALLLFLLLGAGTCFAATPPLRPPVLPDLSSEDRDHNGLSDRLDARKLFLNSDTLQTVQVLLRRPVTDADLAAFRKLGGTVTYVCRAAAYSIIGTLPLSAAPRVPRAIGSGFYYLAVAQPVVPLLHDVTNIVRLRSDVWPTYRGVGGASSGIRIAILDTGINLHPDLSSRVVAWTDTSGDGYSSAVDYLGHGTHCAGIAAGSGATYGSGATTSLTMTYSGKFPLVAQNFYPTYIIPTSGSMSGSWNTYEASSNSFTYWAPTSSIKQATVGPTSSAFGPWTVSAGVGMFGTGPWGTETVTRHHSTIITLPYALSAETYNHLSGAAPVCDLVGVKVFTNAGSANTTTVDAGVDWVIANRDTYRIRVASASLGTTLGTVDLTERAKFQTLMQNGIVACVAAGNDYPTYTVSDPGNATKVITVAATSKLNAITNYSSNGASGSSKPDCAAPGGSATGGDVISVDTNNSEAEVSAFTDRNANDYTGMSGTSMATPLVARVCGLLVQAYEVNIGPWPSTEAAALSIKNILLCTCWETNMTGEYSSINSQYNSPGLNRGGKDLVEGYGRICPDAAISCLKDTWTVGQGTNFTSVLDGTTTGRKVWARRVTLSRKAAYTFNMTVPSGLDADLYLYDDTPTATGDPVIVASSTSSATTGNTESVTRALVNRYDATTDTYYLVAKRVSGSGTVTLNDPVITPALVGDFRAARREDGGVAMTWDNDSGGLLAGYNVYASASPTGPWRRCNERLIVPTTKKGYYQARCDPTRSCYRLESVDTRGGKQTCGVTRPGDQ